MNEYDVLTLMRRHPELKVIATHLDGVSHATVTSESLRAFAKEKGLEKLAVPAQAKRSNSRPETAEESMSERLGTTNNREILSVSGFRRREFP